MAEPDPLQTLYDEGPGDPVPLPAELANLYGELRFPRQKGTPRVIGNFVSSLDGVVELNVPGKRGGGAISGSDPHDRMVMGILRAVSDAVIVGAGTLRSVPRHLWTPGYIDPPRAEAHRALRRALGKKEETPLNVIVSAGGELDLSLPVFASGTVRVLVVTTGRGMSRLPERSLPRGVRAVAAGETGPLAAGAVLSAVAGAIASEVLLVEGGPRLMGDFLAGNRLDELFLTLSPQVAGRDGPAERPGFVAGRVFAPGDPRWGTLVSVKRAGNHLFLRYAFPRPRD